LGQGRGQYQIVKDAYTNLVIDKKIKGMQDQSKSGSKDAFRKNTFHFRRDKKYYWAETILNGFYF